MHEPTVGDFALLKRILRYVKGTSSMGMHIRKDSDLILSAFCDSDWSGCRETIRSTTGFCTLIGPNLISWSAKRQDTVSGSSTEAEYRALTAASHEISWLSFLLRDLDVHQPNPTLLQCDNLSAVYLSTNPALHKQSKHFENDWHYIREQVALGHIETQHISAVNQLADIFNKPLPRRPFEALRDKLGVTVLPTPSLRGNMGNKTMGLTIKAHQTTKSSPSLEVKKTTKQSNGITHVKEELPVKNRFEMLSRLVKKDPDLVTRSSEVAFKFAMWFWNRNVRPALYLGFGEITKRVDGRECSNWRRDGPISKVKQYIEFCKMLGVTPDQGLDCF
ncbi:Reverse transcriptase Ty1/copia-type domain-containing protein [Raphanus sativus]|nr:Reverse transcriptase Ty1/copia-type domain-containing protein [Raphanus sativus]